MDFERLSRKYRGSVATNYVRQRAGSKWLAENEAIDDLLSHSREGASALDAPIGTGRILPFYKGRGLDAHGLDISPDMLAEARDYARRLDYDVELHRGDVCHIAFPDDHFDIVTCFRFLNWIDEEGVRRVLQELVRVSRDKVLIGVRYVAPFADLGSGGYGLVRKSMRVLGVQRLHAGRNGLRNHHKSFIDTLFRELGVRVVQRRYVERRFDGTDYVFFLLQKPQP